MGNRLGWRSNAAVEAHLRDLHGRRRQDRRPVHVCPRYIRGHALLQQLGRSNRRDAPAPRRACASNRAPRKAPMDVAEVRDADAPASAADAMADARWRWSYAGTAIAASAPHPTGYGPDSSPADYNGSAAGSDNSISGTGSDSDAS